jgi:hypothetical protein
MAASANASACASGGGDRPGGFHVAARYRKWLCAGGENVLGMRLGQGKYGYVYEFCAAGDAT